MTILRWVFVAVMLLMISSASAADNCMFNYQGRVLVQGVPYTGTGKMKVAILATTGTSTVVSLWSHDGTSLAGSEPLGYFDITVHSGVFDTMVGDTSCGMAALPAILFNRNDELKVRVWFNDGVHGYQQLTPDRRLINPRRLGITEVYSPVTLYVDGTLGNDLNSGLSASTAKKTIQAAVNMVPGRLFEDVTIDIANGIYRESAIVSGITATKNKYLIIQGDETTVPSLTVVPNVRLTGTDNDATHVKRRDTGLDIYGCRNVKVVGILFDYYVSQGTWATGSACIFTRCRSSNNSVGFSDSFGHESTYNDSVADHNGYAGFNFTSAYSYLNNCIASNNSNMGVIATRANVWVNAGGSYCQNGYKGIELWTQSSLVFTQFQPFPVISGNGQYGIDLHYDSINKWCSYVNFSSGNTIANTHADTGSYYW